MSQKRHFRLFINEKIKISSNIEGYLDYDVICLENLVKF